MGGRDSILGGVRGQGEGGRWGVTCVPKMTKCHECGSNAMSWGFLSVRDGKRAKFGVGKHK